MTAVTTELFRFPYTVRFHDTDPAGIVFFAHYFRIAHEAYEAWLESVGQPLAIYVDDTKAGLPIATSTADYHRSLRLGERVTITVELKRLGHTSYTLRYRFLDAEGMSTTEIETVHVHLDTETRRPTLLPPALAAVLAGRESG